MALADLLRDPRLISTSPDRELRGMAADYVRRRVRRLVDLNPTNADPTRPGEITNAATRTLADVIASELPKVHAAGEEMWRRVSADTQQLPLDPATVRRRGTKRTPLALKSARAQRRRLVRSIVYQAAAFDITLVDPGGLERLHRICDRRLRIVERMVYDVGRVAGRSWSRAQIEAHPGGPWPDGYERLFEYPRLPPSMFLRPCRPDPSTRRCQAPMQEWGYPVGGIHVEAAIRANPSAAASWRRTGDALDYRRVGTANAVAAIQQLFKPSSDFLARNLMYCDHTIHALHLEALVFAMTKRGRGTAWLDDEVSAQGDRWLRVHFQFRNPAARFLGGSGEPLLFEHATVRQSDLQVGDHLIVYNHPAYAHTTSGVWRLENAIVVQTFPELLMQGHGSAVHNQRGMWAAMIRYFCDELAQHRASVERLATIQGFGQNTLTVDRTRFLTRGMRIDVVRDDAGEDVLAANREIVGISGRRVHYDGGSVSAPTRHRLRAARTTAFEDARQAITGSTFRLVRRVTPAMSQYDGRHQRADWFLTWVADEEEEAVRTDAVRAAFVRSHQLVEYTRERDLGRTRTIGWFPLWQPSTEGGGPRRRNGRIVATEPVNVELRHIAGWTWFFDPEPAKRDRVPVIRPREL